MTYIAYFLAGTFFSNGIPHLTNGISGRKFPKRFPFRKAGEPATSFERWSSAPVSNVIWGMLNYVIGYLLVTTVGNFSVAQAADIASLLLGFVICSIFLSWNFGRVNSE
jgi:hypothetical protein